MLTVKPVNDPTEVIFGCAAVVNVPVILLAVIFPVKMILPALILPAVILPVPVITPVPNPRLPTLALPDVIIELAPATILPVILPTVILPVPVIVLDPKSKLPILALPVTFNVPATLTPVPVTTTIFALPTALILTLPLALGIFTLLLPLACTPMILPPKNALPDATNIAYELVTVALVPAVGLAAI